ncbi:MAG: T9SS type A sorting domain-containing protein [Ferruginibacter sp.]|nr:T9SS type A sorting domain-containing protein [Cytophagales bacterium]
MKTGMYSQAKSKFLGILTWSFFLCSINGFGATCTAVADGNWEAGATWSCGRAPASGDNITIPSGRTVTIQANNGVYSNLVILIFGTLQFTNGAKIRMDNTGIVDLRAGGVITGGNGGSHLDIDGNEVYRGPTPVLGPKYCNSVGCNVAPLPITLVSFTASYQSANESVRLDWITSSEINNEYFTLERSVDAIHFEAVERIPGAGNSRERRAYTTRDENPRPGTSYYRLKQTDYDGTTVHSQLVSVQASKTNGSGFSLSPNPSNGQELNIRLEGTFGNVRISVYNWVGEKVHESFFAEANDHLRLRPDAQWKSGMYWVKLQAGSQVRTQKLLVAQ